MVRAAKADPSIIKRSAEIAAQWDITKAALPQPGCGAGELTWEEVSPMLESLDGRFDIWTYQPEYQGL